ncbi:MAG: AbrB/MazE/SpoVT family DNA-binding domain-containing protein [Arcicella sp.]|nr:AbrB/MazE/SpoVT family DNA-binding domain-containing protein [Arcicella sp.]
MIQTLRKIGNSNGVLIPKAMLSTCGIIDEVEMEVLGDSIVMRSTKKHPRDGWDEAFKQAIANGDKPEGDMFEGMKNTFDDLDWTW